MEQIRALGERVHLLKTVALSMREGAIHTRLVPEVDKILALPDDLSAVSLGEREAIARQVREYEQAFDRLGYSLLDQIMPATSASPVFRVLQAAEEFKARLRRRVGKGIDAQQLQALTRYSLSIGTPPVTDGMRALVSRTLFGAELPALAAQSELLDCDQRALESLFALLAELVDCSLHYSTAEEEARFLREAARFANFEGASLFNRLVITESPERVIHLICSHVFDKFGPLAEVPVRLVEEVDGLDQKLIAQMQAHPNVVFVARVTRIPHALFRGESEQAWQGLIGRLLLIDVSTRARRSNTTIVYTLFPHVARTLRNVQTAFAGRPANTQLTLRRILEGFSAATLGRIREALSNRLLELPVDVSVEDLRCCDWKRGDFFDALVLRKLRRMVLFLEEVAAGNEADQARLRQGLRESVAREWMRYFYGSLDPAAYPAAVLPGGGRGALRLVGEYHRDRTREELSRFVGEDLAACRERLERLKAQLAIPAGSGDELQAAARQSHLRALSPSQWSPSEQMITRGDYLTRTLSYRVADLAARLAGQTARSLEHAAFGNVTGTVAAALKRVLAGNGFGAAHGYVEDKVVPGVEDLDRRVRSSLAPLQAALRTAHDAAEQVKGGIDPVAVSDIEAFLAAAERGAFYPVLVLPEMSWTYQDVFPEKDYPAASTIRVPLNDRHEMDPDALRDRIEGLRYAFRPFPEVFRLLCRSMLVLVNSPHNPTGVVWRRETILKLLQIAADYDLTILDDDSYHRVVLRSHKAREGDLCVAQIYERYREHLGRAVRIHTVGATTKALQGAGDRTGLLHSNDPGCVEYAGLHASQPHLLSLYMTQLKLESGLACKSYVRELEALAVELLKPGGRPPWEGLRELLGRELSRMQKEESAPVAAFEELLAGYEELLRLRQRAATAVQLSESVSGLVWRLKRLRLEKRLCDDVEKRYRALEEALEGREHIAPGGAFYGCIRLCPPGDDRGVAEFLGAIARHRKVDVTWAGRGYVRVSLGGNLPGDEAGYRRFAGALGVYLRLLAKYWEQFEAAGRDVSRLESLFAEDPLPDLQPLLELQPPRKRAQPAPIAPAERGIVYSIEEGRSQADKIFVDWQPCATVEEMLHSRTFRVVYRRLLRKVWRTLPALADLGYERAENQYGPLACALAYRDRQLIDDVFRQLLAQLYQEWHGANTVKVLLARLDARRHGEKVAVLQGVDRKVTELVNDLMHAFDVPRTEVKATSTFAVGCESLERVAAHPALPGYLRRLIGSCTFAGATAALDPKPSYVTGAAKRIADHRYGFTRRDGAPSSGKPDLDFFRRRFASFAGRADPADYLCKAEQVGPFRILVLIHKSCFHLIGDELRLYPQIEEVQLLGSVDAAAWDGVMLFGIPASAMGEGLRTGYVLDRRDDGAALPTAWVAREDATDYVGFFKKTLLTLHNERVKALGGMPVHGAMITLTFRNGLRKTLVFSADSGTGKSETITAMMDQAVSGEGPAAELARVDILAGDMLSLWRGEDGQIYGFSTETGDFLRLSDITATWKARFGDLLERGSYSNLDHPTNPRVSIPGICNAHQLLSPTRVNCFFYIDNYSPVPASAVELSEDPHQILRSVLVRGLRKNKGTSGDQPSLRAGLEFAGETALVTRFRHSIDELLDWQEREIEGKKRACLCYRDGAEDVFSAAEIVSGAFAGKRCAAGDIRAVRHDVLQNLFWLDCGGREVALDRAVYDAIYQPLVSTFCGNPFVDPEGMDAVLSAFAETMRAAKVQTGILRTQLAREGYEFAGPARAARDVVGFLLEDEEVNARFQRNKNKVQRALARTFAGVLEPGTNLPVELEGYNLLLLEEHESTHVAFCDLSGKAFTLSTPYYRLQAGARGAAKAFVPSLALPEIVEAIRDICSNPDHQLDLSEFKADLWAYDRIQHWGCLEELAWEVLLVDGVLTLGSSASELVRFPAEVRKAAHIANEIVRARAAPARTGAA
ncbi:MAG TPA: aminotransferase class I/II-fold pyridoxal phosphate-dependent enzyme [Myxococcales bacterium]